MKTFLVSISIATAIMISISACKSKELGAGFNLFPIEQDRQLGAQVAAVLEYKPAEYPILDS